jgi:hypothetical protein
MTETIAQRAIGSILRRIGYSDVPSRMRSISLPLDSEARRFSPRADNCKNM